ncbi:MAG: hypothetical protein FJ246_02510 [Nitrospira sp.]|nr:hypothetical protein [Nitrospira sp.]
MSNYPSSAFLVLLAQHRGATEDFLVRDCCDAILGCANLSPPNPFCPVRQFLAAEQSRAQTSPTPPPAPDPKQSANLHNSFEFFSAMLECGQATNLLGRITCPIYQFLQANSTANPRPLSMQKPGQPSGFGAIADLLQSLLDRKPSSP